MAVRHQLALQVGFESHAHRMTSEKMAESPDEVLRFLEALSAGIRDKAEQEASEHSSSFGQKNRMCCIVVVSFCYVRSHVSPRRLACFIGGASLHPQLGREGTYSEVCVF